jgi:hypothetical protein
LQLAGEPVDRGEDLLNVIEIMVTAIGFAVGICEEPKKKIDLWLSRSIDPALLPFSI